MKENNKDENIKDIIDLKNDAIKDNDDDNADNNDDNDDDFLKELLEDRFMQFFHLEEEEKYKNY